MKDEISRRDLFFKFFQSFRQATQQKQVTSMPADEHLKRLAVIQGRFCLAYLDTPCTICSERCPVTGAIRVEDGIPSVVTDVCTGCGICHEVCPAPTNAILVLPRKTALK